MLSPKTATMQETKFLPNTSGKGLTVSELAESRSQTREHHRERCHQNAVKGTRKGVKEGLCKVRLQVIYWWVKDRRKKTTWWQRNPNIQNIKEPHKLQFWLLYSRFNNLNTEEWILLRGRRCHGKINGKKKLDTFSQRRFQRCTNHIIIFLEPQRFILLINISQSNR